MRLCISSSLPIFCHYSQFRFPTFWTTEFKLKPEFRRLYTIRELFPLTHSMQNFHFFFIRKRQCRKIQVQLFLQVSAPSFYSIIKDCNYGLSPTSSVWFLLSQSIGLLHYIGPSLMPSLLSSSFQGNLQFPLFLCSFYLGFRLLQQMFLDVSLLTYLAPSLL